ncbi:uncharacterized protein LOC130645141 [Hydractinia symbiolongicarpus]|uniref:uncharacterized protein LOC130645141 n=1 Tax=Hydractinia symbiolongicarpus TaxID=13093 RepID=UPI00255063AF|nr:uncharacterized protein LOC130645141 [Hydractinia symbiolongicarpus]
MNGTCPCEAGWFSDEFPQGIIGKSTESKLYLDRKVVKCNVFMRLCLQNCCERKWDGWNESIFRLSSATCAGYEIGWDFVDAVKTSGQTFSGFVTVMNNSYRRRNHGAQKFMSVPVFIDWFFAWVSAMQIEFRQQCRLCGGESKILACDGTKLGVGFKNTFVDPIENAEGGEILETTLKRLHRCFIFNTPDHDSRDFSQARNVLKEQCQKIIDCDPGVVETGITEFITEYARPAYQKMISTNSDSKERYALAKFFLLLSSDASVDTVLPFRFCQDVLDFVQKITDEELTTADLRLFLYELRFYAPELSSLLFASSISSSTELPSNDVILLLRYLVAFIKNVHSHDEPPEDPVPIPKTYNPAKYGRAYYFNTHGCQVRKMRQFTIDTKERIHANFDDPPDNGCEKRFPTVSKKGTTYVFLWFCPLHGHCYGFHTIPGSEGRKDPAASLLTHINSAPDDIFYDFACSLSEYCKNRESGFFAKTRFFHDVFHGYTHKCTNAFKYNRLLASSAINSSICEQFNSYIQNIKSSCKLMSQTHFALYLQFFIYLWNQHKDESHNRKLNIALSGRADD